MSVFFGASVHAQVPALPGWDLVWSDDFNGSSLDTSRWTALDRKDSFNNEKQYYHPNQVTVNNGNLELTAINVPRQGKAYQSGLITSNDLYGVGRFEARIDLPTTQGMWPAFWLNPNQVQWPTGGEIDIMENRGSQPNMVSSAYHWQTNPGPCCGQHEFVYHEYTATEGGQPVNFHAGFHTYAVEWDETSLRFYVDDNLHFVVDENPNRPVFETPKNIILNLAVGGDFGGDPNGTTVWPQTMYVDYVRYWTKTPALPGDINHDGFVGLSDLDIVLNEWNQSTQVGGGVLLSDFGNFVLNGTYNQWSSGTLTSGPADFRVQANDFGGGWKNLSQPLDASGQTTLDVVLDVNAGNVADAFNVVLIDGDGTQRVYRFTNLVTGDNQTLSIDLTNFLLDNQVGGVPGLDLSNIVTFHLQGSFDNGDPGLPMDLTFDNLSIGPVSGDILLGDINGDGFVGLDDLDIILNNWNAGTPPDVHATIPEPATPVILMLTGAGVTARRRTAAR